MPLPKRKHLTRLRRIFRLPVGEAYFVTINCADRRAIFGDARCAEAAEQTFIEYARRHRYGVFLYCVMPTHVHAIVSANTESSGLSEFVSRWKTWCARQLRGLGVVGKLWQDEFLDHRLRSAASFGQKCEYVVQNPVRAGLVGRAQDWPHTGSAWWEEHWARNADS